MKAVFLDRNSFPNHIQVHYPEQITEVVEYESTHIDQVNERIKDADIILSNKAVLNADSINAAQQLKLVQVMATGINNVDLEACLKRQIAVQNVAGYSNISVPEHTFSLLLALRRNLVSYLEDVRSGKWADSKHFCFLDYPIKDLAGSTMTIIGGGMLGQGVSNIALAFGMKVVLAERKGAQTIREGYLSFEEALKTADVVSLHCPLTDDTRDLISYDEFALMKPSSLLLNISRGGLVNEEALKNALENQSIAGAAFDVATQEPMPLDHPFQALTKRPNFLLTPHIAWASDEAMQKLVDIAMQKISTYIVSLGAEKTS
ncbi:D-2-hydroxyacid dehydrogenase [Marinomonas transparens]|uniref:D-2-hydroxyacid dehydrogenase n=1 Tax=Marinomonas transparens TaxID=2795388 RepID=A0A934JR00_9GAMM|nr:D-2-hydroxyacid dehydrogenase [Marinomonas transparens]MBJ7538203.1 D-2-hydroxyacid dehydrogenase [Marinomonas transparens]